MHSQCLYPQSYSLIIHLILTGTGAHGSSIKYNASISSQVIGVRIVDGKGNIVDISDPEDLKAFRIHLGLLGVVLKVTVYTVPLYKTRATNYKVSDEILTNGKAIKMAQNADQMALYWFPAFNEVVVADWSIVDVSTPGNAYTYDHVPSIYEGVAFAVAVAKEAAFSLTTSTCALASSVGNNELYHFTADLTIYTNFQDTQFCKPSHTF